MQNGKIDIAIGLSVKTKVWKNKSMQWAKLVQTLSQKYSTTETFKQYQASSKEDRLKIKDVGGYVGGYLRRGKRNTLGIQHRQLITLDVDHAELDFWEDFTMLYDCAAVVHSTHSHSDESPRYRIIVPLNRECTPDEYVAISRKFASTLDIEVFDDTTFQPHRLMFWPSVSSDMEYYFKHQKGPSLDVDSILDQYIDWTDTSLWPRSVRATKSLETLKGKQQDPEEKTGIIGAFCRTYSITQVIELFLQDAYEPSTIEDRYTYLHGTTSGGLIVYEDKFAYSHHSTDPISGKLCNAFDLLRVHKFGHLDTSPTSKKSFQAVEEFIRKDKTVKGTLAQENLSSAKYDFAQDFEEDEEIDIQWAEELDVDKSGRYLSSAKNLNLIIDKDAHLSGKFRLNEFDNKRYVFSSMPWRVIQGPEPIRNVDYSGIRNYIECVYGITGVQKIEDAISLHFEKNSYHPIREYIERQVWDNESRIDRLLIDYFGAEDNTYTREAIKKTLVGAVARVFNPGVKFDLVLTLVGEQGTYKSTFVNKLGRGWSSDTFITVNGKDAFEQLQGAWLVEIAELAGLRKAEVEATKHFITKQEDMFRPAYARAVETRKRQCVFIATTNNHGFLKDPTGNRRFMPIDVGIAKYSIAEITDETVNQIWAEAYKLYRDGEKLYMSTEADLLAKKEQKSHSAEDYRKGLIEKYLNTKLPENWNELDLFDRKEYLEDGNSTGHVERDVVCVAEIWCECLGKSKRDMDRYKTREINDIMKSLKGWEYIASTKNFRLYGKQKYYGKTLI